MPRNHARLRTRIWHNPEFLALTSGAQRVYMLAISQDTLNLCGVTGYTPRRWAGLASNTTPTAIQKDLDGLAGAGFVVVDAEAEELWVSSFLKWDGVLSTPNSVIAMSRDFETIRSGRIRCAVVDWFASAYPDGFRRHLADAFPKRFPDGIPDPINYGLADGFLDGIGEPIDYGNGDGLSRAGTWRAGRPRTEVPSPKSQAEGRSPKSQAEEPPAEPAGRDVPLRNGTETTNGTGTNHALVDRLTTACKASNQAVARFEATGVVAWALHHVDRSILEEAIAWAEAKRDTPNPIVLPRGIASTVIAKAADRKIQVPDYDPRAVTALAVR